MLEHAFAPGRRARVGPPIRGYATVVAALLGPALGLAATGARRGDELYVVHLLAVGVTMLIATAAAAALVRAGRRRDDARSVAVGVAFSFMGALLLLHALATPNVLGPDENGLIAFTGGAALPTGALLLGLVGSPWLRSARAIPRLLRVQAVVLAAVALVGIVGFADPGIVPAEPAPHSPPALALLAVSCLLFARIATRAWRTYALTRRPADLAAVVGVAWLGTALVAALLWHAWSLGWWVSHGLEAAGMAGVAAPVALDLRRAAPSRALSGGLAATELVHREEYLLGPQVHALLERLAQADRST